MMPTKHCYAVFFAFSMSMLISVNASASEADDLADAAVISLPFIDVVDNRGYSADPDTVNFCGTSDWEGDFHYRYTPPADQTLNIKAVGDDARIIVLNLADTGNECVLDADNDTIDSPNWWTETFPGLIASSSCDGDCNENEDVALDGGVEYIIAIASYDNTAQGFYCVSMAVGADAANVSTGACNAASGSAPVAVPAIPFYGLLILSGLMGLFGLRLLKRQLKR